MTRTMMNLYVPRSSVDVLDQARIVGARNRKDHGCDLEPEYHAAISSPVNAWSPTTMNRQPVQGQSTTGSSVRPGCTCFTLIEECSGWISMPLIWPSEQTGQTRITCAGTITRESPGARRRENVRTRRSFNRHLPPRVRSLPTSAPGSLRQRLRLPQRVPASGPEPRATLREPAPTDTGTRG